MILPSNPKDFLLKEIPDFHPLSASWAAF